MKQHRGPKEGKKKEIEEVEGRNEVFVEERSEGMEGGREKERRKNEWEMNRQMAWGKIEGRDKSPKETEWKKKGKKERKNEKEWKKGQKIERKIKSRRKYETVKMWNT